MRAIRGIAVKAALAAPTLAHGATFDVDHATRAWLATLSGPVRVRSDAYFDGSLAIQLWGTLVTIAVCWVIVRSGALVSRRDELRRRGWRPWVVNLAVVAQFLVLLIVLTLPWSIYADYWREMQYGLMNQTLFGWLGDQAIGWALFVVFGGPLLALIYTVLRIFPRRWWLVGTAIVAGFNMLVMLLAPVFIMPLFNRYTELPQGPVRTRIVAIARAHAIPADHIYLVDASRQSDRISANVSGLGPTIRISLNDNLLRNCTPDEIVAVLGHEMGHYVLGHPWRLGAEQTLLVGLELWIIAWVLPPLIRTYGSRRGLGGIDDPATVPVLIAALSALSLLFLPIENTMTRTAESEADAFGLDAARQPDAFAAVAMKLSQYRKIEPGPIEEALFFDHPSGRTRVYRAMVWKRDHIANPVEVTPPPLAPAR